VAGADPIDSTSDPTLRANADFRRLWTARSISAFGDSLGLVALIVFVADTAGQAFAVAALLLVGEFIPSLFGPFSGALSDRFDRRRVMVLSELVQAVAVLLIAISLPAMPLLLTLVAIRSLASQVLQPAARSVIPVLVPDRHLESANSAIGFGSNGMEAIGPFVAAGLIEVVGLRAVLLIDVATFLVSAALLTRLRPLPPAVRDGQRPRIVADVRDGLKFMATAPLIRVVALGFVAVVLCNGVDDVAVLFLVRDTFNANVSAAGYLYGAVGVGLLAGYLILSRRQARTPVIALFLLGCAASSLGNLLTGLAWTLAVAFVLQLVRGVGLSALDIGVNTLVQRQVPAAMTGRVFGTLYGAVGAAAAISYLAGAALLETTGPRVTFVIAGGIGLLCTIATAAIISRQPPPTTPVDGPPQ